MYETMGGKQKYYYTLFGKTSKIKGICCYFSMDDTMELDEMLLPMPQKVKGEKGIGYFPIAIFAALLQKKKLNGMVETNQEEDSDVTLFDTLYELIKKNGKPKRGAERRTEIYVHFRLR